MFGPMYLQTNTFQAILVTNGRHSYAIFNYGNITWTYGDASGGIPAQVTPCTCPSNVLPLEICCCVLLH